LYKSKETKIYKDGEPELPVVTERETAGHISDVRTTCTADRKDQLLRARQAVATTQSFHSIQNREQKCLFQESETCFKFECTLNPDMTAGDLYTQKLFATKLEICHERSFCNKLAQSKQTDLTA
jgi:hypothetical protein